MGRLFHETNDIYSNCIFFSSALKAQEITTDSMIKMLQQGGYILYVRHGATDHSQADSDLSDLRDCSKQRNLSAQGIVESRKLGEAIRKYNIKVAKVLSSPYCRCVDTATYAFEKVEIDSQLRATFNENAKQTSQLVEYLSAKLKERPPTGSNIVLVAHTANLREVTKVWPKPEGVVHIFKPTGDAYRHIGRITPNQWQQYLEQDKK
ncbi:histidine phosphatase family protein [Aliiglaciecola sp. LCG003]|uniref:histidine phosphatase family protein n=1 Tax=Aliiglaciecola sp. LCG003 TaxID=3053655 RepID=UPI00257230A0|nr:histidine phosphatase family protein [Aliiglaciecola sp. LCG003]WJG10825.1 histidine phosphatase family protein [Aliiglaciecola sp. LCG003]